MSLPELPERGGGGKRITDPPEPALLGEEIPDGTSLGPYLVERLVARAGFSNVYRATEISTGREVAIKVLRQQMARSRTGKERFQREFDALCGITHPNLVEMLNFGQLPDGRPYIVMEWLDGVTLSDFIDRGRLPVDQVVAIVEQLCAALGAAHAVGVIHRDLKGSNVMLIKTGEDIRVKLVDFGIAKAIDPQEAARSALTTTGQALGTPYTMAPEQITGRPLDARTDVYALGILLFEMLTGKKPFTGTSPIEVADKHLTQKPPHAYEIAPVSHAVDAVIARCLAKSPDGRFATPGEVAAALKVANVKRTGQLPALDRGRRVPGLGLHIDFYLLRDIEQDEVFDELDDLRDHAQGSCARLGMRIASATENSFLAVLPLLADGARLGERHVSIVEMAIKLLADLTAFNQHPDLISIRMNIHRAPIDVEFVARSTEFVGGSLLKCNEWVWDQPGLYITGPVLAECDNRFETEAVPDSPEHVRVRGTKGA